MDPVESSINSTFGVVEVVNNSVSSAMAIRGMAIKKEKSRANTAEDFLVNIYLSSLCFRSRSNE